MPRRARAAVGRIAGGSVVNVTPVRCMAEIDIRLPPGVDPDRVQAALDRAGGPPVSVERMDYKPPVETAGDDPFLATCLEQTAAVTGGAVAPRGVAYFSDGCVLAPRFGLPMVIVGPGPVGGSGSVDEWCDCRAIEQAEEIYYRIASACLT